MSTSVHETDTTAGPSSSTTTVHETDRALERFDALDPLLPRIERLKRLVDTHGKVMEKLVLPIALKAIKTADEALAASVIGPAPPSIEDFKGTAHALSFKPRAKAIIVNFKAQMKILEHFRETLLDNHPPLRIIDGLKYVEDHQRFFIDKCRWYGGDLFNKVFELDEEMARPLIEKDLIFHAYVGGDFKNVEGFLGMMETWNLEKGQE